MDNNETQMSPYRGSETTKQIVAGQILKRWGEAAASRYDPYLNCLPLRVWNRLGYRVKSGEKAIRSLTIVEIKNGEGNVVKRYRKNVFLFFDVQVEPAGQVTLNQPT